MTRTVTFTPGPLEAADVVDIARRDAQISISADAFEAMEASRAVVDALAEDATPHYGISTGFGALATKHIPTQMREQLQASLIRSHAASSGRPVDREVVRALMVNRLATMTTGRTGVRPVVASTYAAILNAGITPVIGEYGSLGCSGDLAPLSHCALALMGEGEVTTGDGEITSAADALAAAGIEPVQLREKEGLALINGTDGMLGMLLMAIEDLRSLFTTADIAAAMSIEALRGTDAVFAEDLHALRPQPGQVESAANMRELLAGSPMVEENKNSQHRFTRVQDAYSLRCAPQIHGAGRSTLAHAESVAGFELAAAIDNPVVTVDGRVESNGNFHGAPIGYVLDFLAIAVADLASASERRTDRMLDKNRSHGLNPFLAEDPGVDSGHMIAQYTQAGIVAELKRLAVPASADSIPSSAMQEDHVSLGWSAGLKLRTAIDGMSRVLAVEILSAARAMDMRENPTTTPQNSTGAGADSADGSPADHPGAEPGFLSTAALGAVRKVVRANVPGPGEDRYLAPEIEAVLRLVRSGEILAASNATKDAPLR